MANPDSEHVIVESARYQSRSQRRPRNPWTVEEEEFLLHLLITSALERGVRVYGVGEWRRIRSDLDLPIHPSRTVVDLKDKWRNRVAYRQYSANKMRRYILLDEMHQPRLSFHSQTPHIFNNRWPREAALKAASRDDMYIGGLSYCMIYIREIGPEVNANNYDQAFLDDLERDITSFGSDSEERRIVHVYRGKRNYEKAPDIEKFKGSEGMWVAEVEKVREEKLLARQSVIRF